MGYDANKKSVGVAHVLWFSFGVLGGHRFQLRRAAGAIVMLVDVAVSAPLSLIGVAFVGLTIIGMRELVVGFLIPGLMRDYDIRPIPRLNM